MTVTVQNILSSVAFNGTRITTLRCRYPRFIHSEFMTHRMFSRNASSSRAIPVQRLIESVEMDPVFPSYWGKNQPGMQARERLSPDAEKVAIEHWREACRSAVKSAKRLMELGAHKQIVNRLLEPFSYIFVLVTATEWDNFLKLRDHPDAQPEMQELARKIKEEIKEAPLQKLNYGQWHLPFIEEGEKDQPLELLRMLSVARCARTSYYNNEGKVPIHEEDVKLYDRLRLAKPPHLSPFEHQATPMPGPGTDRYENFTGWRSFRHAML